MSRIEELRGLLWRTSSFAVFGGIVAALIAFTASPKYEAEIAVLPVTVEGGQLNGAGLLSSVTGQLGGLASLAGIGGAGDAHFESIETLESHALARRFVEVNNLMPVLFAHRWDAHARRWRPSLFSSDPSLWDADKLLHRIIQVREDRRTQIVRVDVTWTDRDRAASWANGLVELANDFLRQAAMNRATSNLAFLNEQLEHTTSVEVRQTIFHLIENEMKQLMLARTMPEYAFRVIDPAVPPKEREWPRPALMIVFGLVFGALVWISIEMIFVTIREKLSTLHGPDRSRDVETAGRR